MKRKLHNTPYAKYRSSGDITILMHRDLCGLAAGDRRQVDHINGDGLDNRRINLRICTPSQNSANKRKGNGTYSSKYKGVSWAKDRSKWDAYIRVNRVLRKLGGFVNEDDAARAYNEAALKAFGGFANLNVVDP